MKKRKIGTRGIMMITTMSIMIAAVIIWYDRCSDDK